MDSFAASEANVQGQHCQPAGQHVPQAHEHGQQPPALHAAGRSVHGDESLTKLTADAALGAAAEGGVSLAPDDTSQEQPQASSWQRQIWECLHSSAPPSAFACDFFLHHMPCGCPEVVVEGVGQLALPLCPEQAATLWAVAEQAPYGKGMATVVDTDVRSAMQVDASKVAIGLSWEAVLQGTILPTVAQALSLTGPSAGSISAELYKLLLYERGGHFAAHRDTEKAPRMFATLVVQLPCAGGHEGGRLVVRHGGRELEVDTAQEAGHAFRFSAFFADCEHQLLPITAGRRLVLAYNLCWTGQGSAPHAPDVDQAAKLADAVQAWERDMAAGGQQARLALPLEHQYTDANLSFDNLKGGDRRLVQVAAACPLLECHLALIKRTVSGGTNSPVGHSKRRRMNWLKYEFGECYFDDEDAADEVRLDWEEEQAYIKSMQRSGGKHVMKFVNDTRTETEWCAWDGSRIRYSNLCPDAEFFHPEGGGMFGSQPDQEEYERYTGNSGPTLEYIYHRAVLVLWPRSRSVAIATSTSIDAALSLLSVRLLEVTSCSPEDPSAALSQAQEALDAVVHCFEHPPQHAPLRGHHSVWDSPPSFSEHALELLVDTRDAGLPNAEAAATRLLAAPSWRQECVRLASPWGGKLEVDRIAALAAAVSELAAAFGSAAVDNAVQQLVRAWAVDPVQAQICTALVAALAGLPALQQQAAMAAGEALQAASLGAAAPAAEAWQPLLDATKAQPAVQWQLALAAADTLLGVGSQVFAQQQPSSVLALSDLLLSTGLGASHYRRYAAACMKRQDWAALVQQLLNSYAVQAYPTAQEQLAVAAADALLGGDAAVFAQQPPAWVLVLSDMLLTHPGLSTSHYDRFVAACVRRQDSHALMQQLLNSSQVRGHPAIQQKLARTAADALLASDGTVFAQQQPALLLGMSNLLLSSPALTASHYQRFVGACVRRQDSQALLQLLLQSQALKAKLGMWEQVALTAADTLLAPDGAVFAQQQPALLLAMSDLLLSRPSLTAIHYARFAAACLQRRDCQALLQQLLRSPAVQAAAAVPAVQQLVACRLAFLQTQTAMAPAVSWCMPEASLPDHPQVEAFLQGPDQETTTAQGMFSTVGQAREWAQRLFNSKLGVCTATYSARAEAGGRGKNAYCRVIKTPEWYRAQVQQHQALLAELQVVAAMRVAAA